MIYAGAVRPPRTVSSIGLVGGLVGVVLALVGVVSWVAGGRDMAASSTGALPLTSLVAAVPYWNLGPGADAVTAHSDLVSEISPWTYGIGPGGTVVSTVPPQDLAAARGALAQLQATGRPLMPSISNNVGGGWTREAVETTIHDPATAGRHVQAIVDVVVQHGYAGIDVDYEELRAADRAAFTAFVTQLAEALHDRGKRLSVALFAKVDDAGDDERNLAQDYAAIGAVVDEVRLMTYDFHWPTSPPGPLAPSSWVRDVLAYATRTIPPEKIVLGVAVSGYDWVGDRAHPITLEQAASLAADRADGEVQFDPDSESPWFRYTGEDGSQHEVWYEDERSLAAKRRVAADAGVRSIFLWMFGPPSEAFWQELTVPAGGDR